MRNWNTSFQCQHSAAAATVLSLPMRNWNLYITFHHLPCRICFESTYEELKPDIVHGGGDKTHVLSLPMRNWNMPANIQSSTSSSVLSLPMRNWNSTEIPITTTELAGFESTYEELKLRIRYSPEKVGTSFESTYEELKLFVAGFLQPLFLGFESTYEELKLPLTKETIGLIASFESTYEELKLAWLESFRDGDISFESTYEELKLFHCSYWPIRYRFWVYLWGIETMSTIIFAFSQISVLSLPMRNWNLKKV